MIYFIYGPPGSGKTTYALSKIVAGDIIIDFDRIAECITAQESHSLEFSLFDRIDNTFRYLVNTIEAYPGVRHTYIIRCAAERQDREPFKEIGAELYFMETPKIECIRNCTNRSGNYGRWKGVVDKWFKNYEEEL